MVLGFRKKAENQDHVKRSRPKRFGAIKGPFQPFEDLIEESCGLLFKLMTDLKSNGDFNQTADFPICQIPLDPGSFHVKGMNTTHFSKMKLCCVLNQYYQFGLIDKLGTPKYVSK